jgi:hypothetical protein
MRARAGRAVLALAVASGAASACKGEKKRGLGLAGRDGGAPVVVIEDPVAGGAVGPLEREVEPNDERDRAARLPMPGGVSGSLARADDIDFYRIEAGPARAVVVRLTGPPADEGGGDLVLELFDADGKPVARSDRGPAGTLEGLPNAALTQRAVHYVAVSQFVKKGSSKRKKKGAAEPAGEPGAAQAALAYQLTIDAVSPGPEDEVEPNDAPDRAGQALLAEEKSGYLGWGKDQDLWKLSLAGFAGGYGLDLTVSGVEGIALAVDILGPDGRVLAARKAEKDRALLVRGLLPELGAQFYMARVSGSRSNPEQPYRLRATSRALGDGDEAEPNDDVERAIAAGTLGDGSAGERRGFLDGGDTDVYKFEAGREALGLTVSVEAPASIDVVLRVLGPSGAEVARADGGKAGQREEIAGLIVGRGEVRFVAVTGTALGDEADPYVLRWASAVDLGGQGAPPEGEPADESVEPPPVDDPYEQ